LTPVTGGYPMSKWAVAVSRLKSALRWYLRAMRIVTAIGEAVRR